MSTVFTVREIADELQRAYDAGGDAAHQALRRHMGDKVEIRHEPPSVTDGIVSPDALDQHREAEQAAFRRAMPDFRERAVVSVRGADIAVELTFSGTLADGTATVLTIPSVYTLQGGTIVRISAQVDPERSATLRAALAEQGFVPRPITESGE